MINTKVMRSAMILGGDTQESLAKYLGLTRQTVNKKVNGKVPFNADEIEGIVRRYSLTNDALLAIFFADCVK